MKPGTPGTHNERHSKVPEWPGWVQEGSRGLGCEWPWGKPASTCPSPFAVLQSVLCGADALIPVQTGAAGSASLTLLGNGSLIYQVRVRDGAGVVWEVRRKQGRAGL